MIGVLSDTVRDNDAPKSARGACLEGPPRGVERELQHRIHLRGLLFRVFVSGPLLFRVFV